MRLPLVAAFVLLSGFAGLRADDAIRPAQTVPAETREALGRALVRYLPPGTEVSEWSDLEPSDPVIHFVAPGPDGPLRGEVLLDGTLVWLSREVELSQIPPSIRSILPVSVGSGAALLEQVKLLAYEAERDLPDGSEHERFFDPRRRLLFEVTKPPELDGDEFAEELATLPEGARAVIESYVGDRQLLRLQREIEWGEFPVHAAKWRGPYGVQEVKVFDDGRILFLELPRSERIPDWLRRLAGADVEVMFIQAWSVRPAGGPRQLFLSTGLPVEPNALEPLDETRSD